MAQPFKKRSEGRKKWEKGLDNSGNIEGNSNGFLAPPRRRRPPQHPPPAAPPCARLLRAAQSAAAAAPEAPRSQAEHGAAWRRLVLDMRLRMGEGSAAGVPWGDGLGKGDWEGLGGRPSRAGGPSLAPVLSCPAARGGAGRRPGAKAPRAVEKAV